MSYPTIDATHKSPNHSLRNGALINMLCLHATVGSGKSSLDWLTDAASEVSSHYLIYKSGAIYQLVPDALAAWHAGKSAWFDLNSADIQAQSIGIELENANNGIDPYPAAQMGALLWLSKILVAQYRIVPDMVVRHLDIAIPKGRKTDPAGFPWAPFKAELFAATPKAYRVLGLPVYEASNRQGKLWGHLEVGEHIVIDDPNNGHLQDNRGFIRTDPDTLEAL